MPATYRWKKDDLTITATIWKGSDKVVIEYPDKFEFYTISDAEKKIQELIKDGWVRM